MNNRELTPYQALFQFIRLNTEIANFLKKLTPDTPKVKQLLAAIQRGDATDPIFSKKNIHAYILYLMRENFITFNEGITTYVYAMALMQFTNQNKLKPQDSQYQCTKTVFIEKMVENGRLTLAGETYVDEVVERLKLLSIHIDKEELIQKCLHLSPVEQWLMKISVDKNNVEHDAHKFFQIIAINLPLISSESLYKQDNYTIPSTTILDHFMDMNMLPIFGRVGVQTLTRLHQQQQHPLPLYSRLVTRNMCGAHDYQCGPFVVWIHDLAHNFWASLLPVEKRNEIFNLYRPQIDNWRKMDHVQNDAQLLEYLDRVYDKLADFDLSPICKFVDPTWRFPIYLMQAFEYNDPNPSLNTEQKYVKLLLDKLIFVFLNSYYSDLSSQENKNKLIELLSYLVAQASPKLPEICGNLKLIEMMTKQMHGATENVAWPEFMHDVLKEQQYLPLSEIQIEAVIKTIEAAPNLIMLWEALRVSHNQELQYLISNGFHFFPPYSTPDDANAIAHPKLREAFNKKLLQHTNVNREQNTNAPSIEENPSSTNLNRNSCNDVFPPHHAFGGFTVPKAVANQELARADADSNANLKPKLKYDEPNNRSGI